MDHLRRGIHLRGYAQKNPKQEYKREAFNLFEDMLENMKRDVTECCATCECRAGRKWKRLSVDASRSWSRSWLALCLRHDQTSAAAESGAEGGAGQGEQRPAGTTPETFVRQERKVGRNEPCPCGSGKKYKQCCGKVS